MTDQLEKLVMANQRIAQLQSELAALREDKERLDWLEHAKVREAFEISPALTFREAIDAARTATKGEKESAD